MANNNWISIPNTKKISSVSGYDRSRTPEEREKERLRYWSWFWNKRNHVNASSCRW